MATDESPPIDNTRVSVSLSTLRAELVSMELRIVDRLNGALANKADRAMLEQIAARQSDGLSRLSLLENKALLRDGPVVQKVDLIEQELASVREVGKYKKWLWAQTIALAAIALPALGILGDQFVNH